MERFTETKVMRMLYMGEYYDIALQCNYCAKDRRRESRQSREMPYDEIIKAIGDAYARN